ncbi:MAG TPA: FAD binding domain-containing protein [Thermoanaerobaculia bacterium]|jgi:xanthine dehydrogenase YagS FAD-binding subunit|nr:FAD binding domain-containing protein [Thermoanaerobaculia bacterium]
MKPFALVRPKTLAEAAKLSAPPDAEVKAGGVDLVDRMKEGLDRPRTVVSIIEISGHDRIEAGPPAKIGALATLAAIADDPGLHKAYPALPAAAGGAATPQIRHMATLGGNLCQRPRCWYYRLEEFDCRKKGGKECFARDGDNRHLAIFDSDLACCCVHPSAMGTALLAYGATLEIVGPNGTRKLPIDQFFYRPVSDSTHENTLSPGEIVAAASIPPPAAGARSAYRKLKQKESFDWPLVETCVDLTIDGGVVRSARVVFGSVAPTPYRSKAAEAVLVGGRPGDELARRAAEAAIADAKPLTHNAYKVTLAKVELERALKQAWA